MHSRNVHNTVTKERPFREQRMLDNTEVVKAITAWPLDPDQSNAAYIPTVTDSIQEDRKAVSLCRAVTTILSTK